MITREDIISRIKAALPSGTDPHFEVLEESALSDLGVSSIHLITMLLTLRREYGLDIDQVTYARMPSTVGELVSLVENSVPAR
jgi:acyl carrier protein